MVVPPGEAVLTSVAAAADAVYVGTLRLAHRGVLRVPYDRPGDAAPIPMPADAASAAIVAVSPRLPGLLLHGESWTHPGRIFCFNPEANAVVDTGLQPMGDFAGLDDITATEVMVRSHDGVGVPFSIIHRKDLPRDGSKPAIISGYGAYGAVTTARFDATSLAWLDRGGVLAVAHVRGGGTFGKAWHHAGRKTTKPNTWKDLIACAEYLVEQGYTAPQRLAVRGRSGGGILAGRAITERPDLFAAAEIAVGCTDMVRFELTENGPPNVPEFGSLAVPEEFRALLAMSTLHQIVDGKAYPAVLLTHGINDRRVEPWQSFKTAARLQAATSSKRPILLRLDYQSGHGIGSARSQRHAELADIWAFILWQLGDPAFQPRAADAAPPEHEGTRRDRVGRSSCSISRDETKE